MAESRVTIRENASGESRVRIDDVGEYADTQVFWWSEGNGSCDCNRRLWFERALDPDYGLTAESPCGDGGYSVVSLLLDGVEVWPARLQPVEDPPADPPSADDPKTEEEPAGRPGESVHQERGEEVH